VGFGDSDDIPLRWGEVIPLSFINKTLNTSKLVIMGIPLKRYNSSVSMIN
jgi:aromatic ring-opening dioxygenase LigB subunit